MNKFILFFLLAFSANTQAQSESLLSSIPIYSSKPSLDDLTDNISFDLHVDDAISLKGTLSQWDNIQSEVLSDTLLKVSLNGQAHFNQIHGQQTLKDSFVIDFKEPSTQVFIQGFNNVQDTELKDIEIESLANYVSEYITEPTYIHSFNIASRVASQRSGDCTEYAALTTALTRALGIPARYVVGFVIYAKDNKLAAFGHAWTEVLHQQKWQILDAALFGNDFEQLYYIPTSALENEGPGYTLSLASAIFSFPSRIDNLQNAIEQ
ncbi:transglutaminase-like domain-containing protein [Glaciecola sp. KUL10]|uniref:transglutaminase-like domain-containing protein n=1 Tax=Glaciecola sp. (strain KUL10) TaxID=2161813 RepID=UPI000D783BDB|nr:transglutaminase-like domain-containing protein [Glaciecola sp. KUL10]GBL05577.1 hypothetical protein KUL10_29030 [Glaciecola sp. KUL10]